MSTAATGHAIGPLTGPLTGVRVLDLSAVVSGPLATAILAEQGARVIKVEPFEGDTARRVGPAKGDMSAMYITANRGKRSLALNLKVAAAREVVKQLAAQADVMVENFRPGAMARLGLGQAAMRALNPRLIYVSITGFGQTGPDAQGRVYDAVIQAASGVAASHPDAHTGEPTLLATLVCDKLAALTAAQAISAALFARERDGQGRHIKLAMLDAALAFQWPDAMYNHVFIDEPPAPYPEIGRTLRPWRTRDGFVATMSPQQDEFAALCTGLGLGGLIHDPRFATLAARARHGAELRALLEPSMALHDSAELVQRLRDGGVPIARISSRGEVLSDPQVQHNQAWAVVDHGSLGRVRLPRGAARFDVGAPPMPQPAPGLGAHTHEVLRELGYDDAGLAALSAAGAIR